MTLPPSLPPLSLASDRWRFVFTGTRVEGVGIHLQEVVLYGEDDKVPLSIAAAVNPGGRQPEGKEVAEGPGKAIDGDTSSGGSKWLDLSINERHNSTLELTLEEPALVLQYDFYIPGNALGRNPTAWSIYRNDGNDEWQLLSSQLVDGHVGFFESYGGFSVLPPSPSPPSLPPPKDDEEIIRETFCPLAESGDLFDVRSADPPEWCNGGGRAKDAVACENSYAVVYIGLVAVKHLLCRFSSTASPTRCYLSGPHNGAPEDEIWCGIPRFAECDLLDLQTDVQKLDPPEWCNSDPERSNSKVKCEQAYATTWTGVSNAGELFEKRHKCVYNETANTCRLGHPYLDFTAWCLIK